MNDYAMRYEYLIRRAFNCGRFGVSGANADVFRGLERDFVHFRDNKGINSPEERMQKYAFSCGEVATYIKFAVEKFAKKFDNELTEEQKQEVEDIVSLLYDATINEIEQAIDRGEALMLEKGVYPG